MARAFVLVLVAMLLQALRPAAQAPAAELYPIVFVHGFSSDADTWSVMTTALSAFNPARYGTTVTRISGVGFPGQDASRRNLGSSLAAAVDDRALELDTFTQCLLIPSTHRAELGPGSATRAFTVRVHAQHAAGESPASNELAFTMPSLQ